jgi:HD-like signal output (HDOD) protein
MSVRLPERPRALVSERRQSVPQSPTSGPAGTETPRPPIPSVLTASSPSIEVSSPPPSTPTTAPKPSAIINPFAGWSKKEVQDRIRELVGDIEIPRFRKAVFETLRRLRDPDTTPQKLMEVMAIDGELVGKVMNTVNSTAYSPRSRIQSLDHAILLMGNADLERIVMMVGAKAALPQQTHPQFALSTFWKASSRRAVLAREIADLVQPAKANLSFTAGFLQDLSVPLIVTSKKDQYVSLFNTALDEKRDLHLLEAETLGWDHAELGALVALNWELPDDVTLCLKDHNQPESASRPDPAYFVSSLLPSHGEEWHSHFATRVNDRYVVAPEILDSICKDSIQKANDLAKLF